MWSIIANKGLGFRKVQQNLEEEKNASAFFDLLEGSSDPGQEKPPQGFFDLIPWNPLIP